MSRALIQRPPERGIGPWLRAWWAIQDHRSDGWLWLMLAVTVVLAGVVYYQRSQPAPPRPWVLRLHGEEGWWTAGWFETSTACTLAIPAWHRVDDIAERPRARAICVLEVDVPPAAWP